jgi:hypothetical protein
MMKLRLGGSFSRYHGVFELEMRNQSNIGNLFCRHVNYGHLKETWHFFIFIKVTKIQLFSCVISSVFFLS